MALIYGGGGFFLAGVDFGRLFDHSPPALCFLLFSFVVAVVVVVVPVLVVVVVVVVVCVCVCVCLFFLAFFFCGDQLTHTNSTLSARISPQWLSELRRLWPNVP